MSNKLVFAAFVGISAAVVCAPGAFAQQTGVLIQGNSQVNTATNAIGVAQGGGQLNLGVVGQNQRGFSSTPQTGVLIQGNSQTNTLTNGFFVRQGGPQINAGAVLQNSTTPVFRFGR